MIMIIKKENTHNHKPEGRWKTLHRLRERETIFSLLHPIMTLFSLYVPNQTFLFIDTL